MATSCVRCRTKKLSCFVNGKTRRKAKAEAEEGPSGGRIEELLGSILAVLEKMHKSNRAHQRAVQGLLQDIADPAFSPGDVRVDEYDVDDDDLCRSLAGVLGTLESDQAAIQRRRAYPDEEFDGHWEKVWERGEAELLPMRETARPGAVLEQEEEAGPMEESGAGEVGEREKEGSGETEEDAGPNEAMEGVEEATVE